MWSSAKLIRIILLFIIIGSAKGRSRRRAAVYSDISVENVGQSNDASNYVYSNADDDDDYVEDYLNSYRMNKARGKRNNSRKNNARRKRNNRQSAASVSWTANAEEPPNQGSDKNDPMSKSTAKNNVSQDEVGPEMSNVNRNGKPKRRNNEEKSQPNAESNDFDGDIAQIRNGKNGQRKKRKALERVSPQAPLGRKGKSKNLDGLGLEKHHRSMSFPIESVYKNKVFGSKACEIDINTQLGANPQPLYLYPNGDFVEITNPYGRFFIERKDKITVFCEHGFKRRPGHRVDATCLHGNFFMVNNEEIEIGSMTCNGRMLGATRRIIDERKTCLQGRGEMAEIGFRVGGDWKPLFEVCHNAMRASSEWTHHIIDPMNIGFQKKFSRDDMKFLEGDSGFYADMDKNVGLWYTRKKQRETFAKILPGGRRSADNLVSLTTDQFLARGHLTAKADQIFGAHQLATFFFINVAPQWQSFNGGNWRFLEDRLKKFIARLGHRAEVYTGTHGVMKHEGVELFLYVDEETGVKKLPVPRIYYKIVVVKSLNQAIVIIGINNPFVTDGELKGEYNYCTDISRKLNILRLAKQYHRPNGYMMACEIQDFFNNKRMKNETPFIENLRGLGVLGLK